MGIGAAVASGIGAIASGIGAGAAALGIGADAAGMIGTIGADALVGAGTGAALSAVTGGKPGIGALTGALTGGAGAAGGLLGAGTALGSAGGGALGGALGGAAGSAMTGSSPVTGALMGGVGGYLAGSNMGSTALGASNADATGIYGTAAQPYGAGMPSGGPAAAGSDVTMGAISPQGMGNSSLNPVSQTAASTGGGGSASGGGASGGVSGLAKGINSTDLMLGALSAAGSLAKPKIGTWQTPGPASNAANLGPYWNTPVNTNVPGRTVVAPSSSIPTAGSPESAWYTYGQQPVGNPFTNNSLSAYGFARGGALSHAREFATRGVSQRVRGPGTGTSDEVPARLSDGEYVLTEADVSRIGNGDNSRGAHILDHDRGALARTLGEAKFTRRKLRGRGA